EKAVLNALSQAVLINGVAKIRIGVAVLVAQRRCRHAYLKRRFEIVEDSAPRAVFARAAAMALVNDDEIEEIGWVLAEQTFTALVLCECLVNREIHFTAEDDFTRLNLVTGVAERRKRLVLWIVHQNVAVSQK